MNPYEIAQTHLPSGWLEDGVKRLAEAIEAYANARLEAAWDAAFYHSCEDYCDCKSEIMNAIRALIDQPPPPARGESTG